MKLSKKWLVDTAERVVGTFLEAFVATLVVSASGVSLTAVKTAALAGLASALTLVKSLVGAYVGNPDSASVIPSVGAPGSAPAAQPAQPARPVIDWEVLEADTKPPVEWGPPASVEPPVVSHPAPSHPGAIPADRVTPLYPSPQQS